MKWNRLWPFANKADVSSIFDEVLHLLRSFVEQYNAAIKDESLRISISAQPPVKEAVLRALLFNTFFSLSIRADEESIKGYIFQSDGLTNLARSETDVNLRLSFTIDSRKGAPTAILDGEPMVGDQMAVMLLSLFEDFARKSYGKAEQIGNVPRITIDQGSISSAVQHLVQDNHSLLTDLLDQHELIHNALSREIHDDVVSDLLFLKKAILEKKDLTANLSLLDGAVTKLRNICSGLSCRDLQDWGLEVSLKDMVARAASKSTTEASVAVETAVPILAFEVQLQVYRVLQEAVNNVIKHAHASAVTLRVYGEPEKPSFSVCDNGVGFSIPTAGSGTGLKIMRERVAIINAVMPAQISIQPVSPTGTCIVLTLQISTM